MTDSSEGPARFSRTTVVSSVLSLVVGVMVVSLIGGVATKAGCASQLHHYCLSDIQQLWTKRALGRHLFPYVHGRYVDFEGVVVFGHGEIEYPVLTGLFAWLAGLPVRTGGGFLVSNMVLLAPFGLLAAWGLARMGGRRALYFVAAPSIAMYGFMNWDLLAVGLAVAGVWAWWRQRPYLAAVLLALGGCAKFWPALLLVPLCVELWVRGRRRRAVRVGGAGVLVALILNVPFMLINFRGWYAPFVFQSARAAGRSTNSIWYYLYRWLSGGQVNDLAWLLTVAGGVLVVAHGVRRFRRDGTFPFLQTSFALVIVFVLCAKAFSPQYALWLLPFFALVRVRRELWVSFVGVNVALWISWYALPWGSVPTEVETMWRLITLLLVLRECLSADAPILAPPPSKELVPASVPVPGPEQGAVELA